MFRKRPKPQEGNIVYTHGQQFTITKEYPKVGDLFINLLEPAYSECVSIGVNGTTITRKCICGMCNEPETIVPIENCRKLVSVNPINN